MKRKLLIAFVFIATATMAQVDLVGYGGYQFGSRTFINPNYLRLKSNPNYGVNLELGVRPDLRIQLSWMGSATYFRLEGFNGLVLQQEDVNVNYYQIGALRPFPVSKVVEPFGSFTMGMTHFNMLSNAFNDEFRFSITFGLGTNIWLTETVGLRMHARLLAPINWAGLGFFCGTGGCNTGVSAGSTFISGDVGGGLVFRLKP